MAPLQGIRVLDFSQVHGATYATMLLADFGAEIIKVEKIDGGDKLRAIGPFKGDHSVYHEYLNRNKKSIAIDLKTERGLNIIKKLVANCEVICENFPFGTMEKLGIGYDNLKVVNPKLVYATLTGYGRSGTAKDKACFENTSQAMSGIMDMTGYFQDAPIAMGAPIGNLYGGMHLASAIILGVINAKKTGKGQFIDVSSTDALFAVLEDGFINWSLCKYKHERNGNMSIAIAPYDTYRTKDGYVSIGVSSDFQWEKFCRIMGMEDLLNDPRFDSNGKRGKYYIEGGLKDRIEAITMQKTKFEIQDMLDAENIPCGSVCTALEAIESDQIKHREMAVTVQSQTAGSVLMPGIPAKLSKTPGEIYSAAPLLGQHSRAALKALDFSDLEIKKLIEDKVVGVADKEDNA